VGQQQLFLLVLTAIIVGLATVTGLNAYQESRKQSAIDHMTQKAIEIAVDVQVYARRPSMYRSENTTGDQDLVVDFGELSKYETNGASGNGDHVDAYATYSLNGHSTLPDGYNPEACPNDSPINTVEAYSRAHDVSVCVGIAGPSKDDLEAGVAE
jgi:hypothetical protein